MNRVILPSAKAVERDLQNIGKIPAVIYPLNQKMTLDYIKDQYDEDTQYYIAAYENADMIEARIKKYKNVNVILLDQLMDLGYTVYYCLENIPMREGDKVIINFGDTFFTDEKISEEEDSYYYSREMMCSKWTYFSEENGRISCIMDKPKLRNDNVIGSLFVGIFVVSHPKEFLKELKAAVNTESGIDSFYAGLMLYSHKYGMKAIKADKWYDIGHSDKYKVAQTAVRARSFNHITIDMERGMLCKKSDNVEKLSNEILWYLKLPVDVEYVRPRIFSYSLNFDDTFVKMEYYSYHTLHDLFLYSNLDYIDWERIFSRIKFIYNDFSRYSLKDDRVRDSLADMYIHKTISRMTKLRKIPELSLFMDNSFFINNVKYKPLNKIIEMLPGVIEKYLINSNEFHIIHGDLCFSNILIDDTFSIIKLIDPRGKFGNHDIYGDQRYELAKILHSIDGKYDYIIKDMFDLNLSGNNLSFHITKREYDDIIKMAFSAMFSKEYNNSKIEIELIESLLFLSMIPLHNENIAHQAAMLCTGIQILDRCVDIKERED